MHEVMIDGVAYIPVDQRSQQVGIGITTHNRYDVFRNSYNEILNHAPANAKVVVVDDASDEPVPEATYRFDENVGIANAKNKCLELLSGCEHIFLFDDDCYPVVEGWERPYIDSPEPHLMLLWVHVPYSKDGQHVARFNPQGSMLYFHRSAIDAAGGFDPIFGRYGSEHGDLSNRIHSFGLTTWRYADVVESADLFYSHDRDKSGIESTATSQDYEVDQKRNVDIRRGRQNDALYVDYRSKTNVVATPLLTGQPDHKYKKRWDPSTKVLTALRKSVKDHKFVVLHDELTENSADDMELVKVPTHGLNPYLQRWVSSWQWLRSREDIGFIWFVDGSDVEMLNDPFPHMEEDTLYLGSEAKLLSFSWMLDNHPSYADFLTEHADKQILNAGLVGGSRDTVLRFLHLMVREIWDNRAKKAHNARTPDLGLGDMALLNHVAYTMFPGRIVASPQVNTVFKANERNEWSWWKHK